MQSWAKETLERMAQYVIETETGCTDWSAGVDKDGYPRLWFQGRTQPASRVLWLCTYGPIPEGLVVRHTCDNPRCLELRHLKLGTPKDNTADALERGRMIGPRKITDERTQEIIQLRDDGMPLQEIADRFNISLRSVHVYLPQDRKRAGNYRRGPR